MKIRYCLSAVILSCMIFAGCGKKSDPVAQVRSKLNDGGTYYLLSDYRTFGNQLNFMLDRIAPSAQSLMAKNNVPFTFAELRSKAVQVCKIAGFDRLQACGASSIVLSGGKNGQPYYFHNRWAAAFAGDALPPFMLIFTGKKTALADFAATVPDNAMSSGIMPINFAAVYKFLKDGKYLPENVDAILRSYLECEPEKFLAGISGKITGIMLDYSAAQPRLVYIVNDQDNRLFKLCGKYLFFDAGKVSEYKLPHAACEAVIRKKAGKLQIFIGPGTAAEYDRKIAAGETMAKHPELKAYAKMLPGQAAGFGINRYINAAGGGKNALANVSAMEIDDTSVVMYCNSFCDWNTFPLEMLTNIVPQLENIMQAIGKK